jgi:membrane protein YqaA with SNARE-associated domain
MSSLNNRAMARRHCGDVMQILLLALAAVAFGAWTTYLLATSIPQKLMSRSARHGRYADLTGSETAEVAHGGPGRRRFGRNRSRSKLAEQ